ncbi:MAG: hypothetical protein H6835_19520 [Planctomycetes bacterium]|nr:hypothetical protein [Planctomycetota bacterium]
MPRGIATPGPLLLLLAAALPAQTGPLLTFIGTADEGVGSDGEHTWLVDAAGDGPAEHLGPGRITVADRFDEDWLVCSKGWPETHYVLLARRPGDHGAHAQRVLVPGGHCEAVPGFVDVQHRRLYVLCPRWDDRVGSLRVFSPDGPGEGHELLDRVEAVIAHSLDGLFVMLDAERAGRSGPAGRCPGEQVAALDPPLNALGMQVSNALVTTLRHW